MSDITPKYLGFIPPKIDETHHIFGDAIPFEIIKKDAIWRPEDTVNELQKRFGFETFNCTSFNTLKKIQIYLKVKYLVTANYSDRFVGIMAGTNPEMGGNDPHLVMEAIRKHGLIPESMLPYSSDLKSAKEYYSFKGANKEACIAAGKKWLEEWTFLHDWVVTPSTPPEARISNMKMALKTSPLSLAVYAWVADERNVYIKLGPENHWTCGLSFADLLQVGDSYDPFEKIVEQDILYCKRIFIEKKKSTVPASPEIQPSLPSFSQVCKTEFQAFLEVLLKILKLNK